MCQECLSHLHLVEHFKILIIKAECVGTHIVLCQKFSVIGNNFSTFFFHDTVITPTFFYGNPYFMTKFYYRHQQYLSCIFVVQLKNIKIKKCKKRMYLPCVNIFLKMCWFYHRYGCMWVASHTFHKKYTTSHGPGTLRRVTPTE